MINHKCRGNRKLIILASLMLLVSCSKESPDEHLQKGIEYFNKGEYEKAVLELKTAKQSDKDTAETYYYLALLDEKNRQYKAMSENLKKTIELSPSHTEARMKFGKVQLILGQSDEAIKQAEIILKEASQNLDALLLKASVFNKQKKYTEALSIVDSVLAIKSDFSEAWMLKALIYMEEEKFNDALSFINSAIKQDPSNVALRLLKLQLHARTQDTDAVIADYHELVSLQPDNQEFKIMLAKGYTQIGRKKEAEDLLRGLIAAQPDNIKMKLLLLEFLVASAPERVQDQFQEFTEQYKDKSKTLIILGSWMIAQKNFDEAKKVLNRVIELDENTEQVISAKMLLAKAGFDVSDFEAAEKIVAEVLAVNPNYIDAKVFQAKLLLIKKQYDEAIAWLSKILWEKPDSEEALILLAQTFVIKGDRKQAEKQFLRVLEVNPANLQALIYVYDKALAAKDVNYAKEIIEKGLRFEPENLMLLERLVKLNLLANEWDSARQLIQRISNNNNPQAKNLAKYLQGQILHEQGDYAKAIELYKELISKAPDNYDILVNMVRCYESINKKDDMVAFLNGLLAKDHQNISAGIVLSDLLIKDKQFDKTAQLLTNLIDNNKKLPELYILLAKSKLAQGDNKAAIVIYQNGLQQNPGDVKLLLSLATSYEVQGDYDSAISTYETLLAADPGLDIAANNLAVILIDRYTSEEKLAKAIQLTEKFKISIQPYYKDTYAWAIIKQGDSSKGLNLLNQIVTSAPDVPIFRYHLGVAQYKNGNSGAAIAELKQALNLAAKTGGGLDEKAVEILLSEIKAKAKHTTGSVL